jgi:hypothetical protein
MHFSPEKCGGGPLALTLPPFLRVSGTLRREPPFFKPTHQTTAIKCMAHKQNNKTARIDLDITVESQQRFAAIHKALGFKTRTETFEAIVFSITAKDVLHPNVMERIETKLDQALEIIESLT